MQRALEVLNELVNEGSLARYAIGGAMAATFYTEPVVTFDLDIFVVLPETAGGLLSLAALYSALAAKGFPARGEHVEIAGTPVQFLPAYNPLLEEALRQASPRAFGCVPTYVLRAEHLAAISIQTGRAKDRDRARLLAATAGFDENLLAEVLARYQLAHRWKQWTS